MAIATPPPFRLDRALDALVQRRAWRTVLDLVGTWEEIGTPSHHALRQRVKALAALGLADRAWSRLEALLQADVPARDDLALAAHIRPAHPWPRFARVALERALAHASDDAQLSEWWAAATEAATDADPSHVSDEFDDDECLDAAVRSLSHGHHHRARLLIERVRARRPDHPRVSDLVWAIGDDHAVRPIDLDVFLDGLDLAPLPDVPDEAERTESRAADGLLMAVLDDADASSSTPFPNLFRNLVRPTAPADEGERTQRATTADLLHLDPDGDGEATGAGDETQVRRIVTRAHGARPVRTEIEAEQSGPFDLSLLRRDSLGDAEFARLADDDDDVLVRVRHEPEPQVHEVTITENRPVQLERTDSGAPPLPREAVSWIQPPHEAVPPPAPAPRRPVTRTIAAWAPWLAALLFVWTLALFVLTAALLLHWVGQG